MKSCPPKESLFGYLVGTVSEQVAEQIAAHLSHCCECEQTVQALEGLSDTLITALRHADTPDRYAKEPELQRVIATLCSPEQLPASGVKSAKQEHPAKKQPRTTRSKKLDDYEIVEKLGAGGMGTVYKALHTKLKRIVALKVLPKNRLTNAETIARFEREMEAVGQLDHPHIVRAMDAREVAGIRFLVMEYVDGLDLAAIGQHCGALSIPDACEVARQAALGLQCCQEHDLVHRDIKPSNLMLTSSGKIKILDLGLAQVQKAESSDEEVTGVGQIMGTPDFMAPEQALESHSVDIRSDLYSLGCTFYRLLAGRTPFSGSEYDTPMKKVAGHLHAEPQPIQLVRPDLPKPIASLIERMLNKDPDERPQSPAVVADALAPFCQGSKLISLLRDARRKMQATTEESTTEETDDLKGAVDVETSRDELAEPESVEPSAAPFDPYHRWLGIPPVEQPANHYRLLGLAALEDDREVIRDSAARQMSHVRTYQLGPHAELSQRILNELAAAKSCLLNREKKKAYDQRLRKELEAAPVHVPQPPAAQGGGKSVVTVAPPALPARPRAATSRKKAPTWVRVTGGAFAFLLLLTIVLSIATPQGRIQIVLSDPKAAVEVQIDGNTIDITGLDRPLRLRVGEHELTVSGKDYETIGRSFTVRRGNNPVLEVSLVPTDSSSSVASPAQVFPPSSNPPTVPASSASAPQAQPGFANWQPGKKRFLGYLFHQQPQSVAEVSGYTNVVLDRGFLKDYGSELLRYARNQGLRVVLEFHAGQGDQHRQQIFDVARQNRDVVIGVCCSEPYISRWSSNDIAAFGQQLKHELPGLEYWLWVCPAVPANTPSMAHRTVPPEVDVVLLGIEHRDTRLKVRSRKLSVDVWKRKAAGRPLGIIWTCYAASPPGLVPKCQPGTMQACAELVEEHGLAGIILDNYSGGYPRSGGLTGIRENVAMVDEIKAIAQSWNVTGTSASATSPLATPSTPSNTSSYQHRWLGYDPGTGAEMRLQSFAGYTNFAMLPLTSELQATHLQSAHQQGLQILLPVTTRERMAELEARFDLLRDNPDPVLGVVAVCPPYYRIQERELTEFAAKLKAELPSCEFWVALADVGKEPSPYPLPALADGLIIDALDCSTPSEVERRMRDVWPKWVDKAAGRSVMLCWDSWQKGTAGLVPLIQLGTFRACGDAVDKLNLQGILFSTFGESSLQGETHVGIETRPDLILEVQAIARHWSLQKRLPNASTQTNRPAGNTVSNGGNESIRAVIVTGDDVTVHRWRETSQALRNVLEAEPQLVTSVEEDPNFLASDRLFDHQVLLLNFSNRQPLSQQQKACENLETFVQQGGGLIVIHAASKAFPDWDRFAQIVGKKMANMATHDPIRVINVHISDPRHPITQGVRDFQVRDELPTCLEGDQPVRVLAIARSSVTGKEHPVAFVLNYGAGRVFHLALGHSPAAIQSREIAAMIRRAAIWVGTPPTALPQPNAAFSRPSERNPAGIKSLLLPQGANDV